MPLYEYECEACGHRFEAIQKFSDPPIEKCPKCGGAVHKLQSAPAFQFKGSGWYITDYARKDQGSAAKGSAGKDSKADGASDASAKESKSDSGEKPSTQPAASSDKPAATSSTSTPSKD